jgi:tetratricopeptide (TPR) repeat protein
MTGVASLFADGTKLHQAGQLADAEQIYNRILAMLPDHVDCLHLLGLIFLQRGNHAQALEQINTALARDPDNVFALNNRGIALKELKHLDEALASYDRALALRPDYAEALSNRGNTLQLLRRFDEALASYDRAITQRPDYVEALLNRGNTLKELQHYDEALASYARVLAIDPKSAQAHGNCGAVLHELQRFDEALASCDRALALRPDLAELHAIRGNALCGLKRYEEALVSYDRALALRPAIAEVHYNRGNVLHELRRFEEALASHDRALTLRPDYVEAHYNRGNALHLLKRFEEALTSYQRALALRPDHAEAIANRGATLHDLKRYDEALESYERALTLRPDFADAHYNEAICRLLLGDFDRGWKKHEWRWRTAQLKNAKRNFLRPLWLGSEEIEGRTILLHAEQGLGDTIQFCRYVPLLAGRGARVILEVQKPLRELMTTLSGAVQVVSRGDPLPPFDLHCPLLSLPLAMATRLETIPSAAPYLAAGESKTGTWQKRLGADEKPRIGIVWAGSPRKELPGANRIDSQRSIAFDQLAPLFQIAECAFYSLQKGDDAVRQLRASSWRHAVVDWTDDLQDFSDTAALMENLDLIVSVDTSVAHLAGALGKPFWLLNRYNTCWRWLADREDSPWYPTARLFRQDSSREWAPVIARAAEALDDYVRVGERAASIR